MVAQETIKRLRIRREITKQAIDAAMASRWEEAVTANRELLAEFPGDLEAMNRLGKALSETGHYAEARNSFAKVLALSPGNGIAKKNLEKILHLKDVKARQMQTSLRQRVAPHFFIEETGKTGATMLQETAAAGDLARVSAGEPVEIAVEGKRLIAKTSDGLRLGVLEPKLAHRLLALMQGGNRYSAAVTRMDRGTIQVFIRETYQHPAQQGKLSFAAKQASDIKSYLWDGLSDRFDSDGEDEQPRAARSGNEWSLSEEHEEAVPALKRMRRPVAAGFGDEEDES